MRKYVISLIVVQLALASVNGASALAGEEMYEVLNRSGALERLRQFPIRILSALRQTGTLVERYYQATLTEKFMAAYNAEAVERLFIRTMSSQVDEETLQAVLAWYDTPTGQKITAIEAAQFLHHLPPDDGTFAQDPAAQPFSENRVHQVRRLEHMLRVREVGEEFVISTALALTTAMNALLPLTQQIDGQLIRQELEYEHQTMRATKELETIQGLLVLYRDLSDQEFEQYLNFVESRHGRKFYRALRMALRHVLMQTSHDLGQALGTALQEIYRQQGA